MRLNAKQIAHCTGGVFVVDPIDASEILTSLTWDSREAVSGCVYVALPGERVDGHGFVAQALAAGARAALVMQPLDDATLLLAKEMGAA
ncbi:MAG: UDP-N-acetylmuramoyl-tripeptide--D-alanyl-D-alanine ligase, partial [Eggerthellaceae bacterium]|nr:UDP-N-acetylmuramoyl-tripeptide--D-alanyl-D-alanine ligase [Eggerthellaceae bacterium]